MKKEQWKKVLEREVASLSLYEVKSFFQQAEREMNSNYPTEYGGYKYYLLKERLLKETKKKVKK